MTLLSAILWYLLGGLTLLPGLILIGFSTFLYLIPKINSTGSILEDSSSLQDPDFPLDSQSKTSALDLALKNDSSQKAHLQHSESLPNQPKGSSQVPLSAKRLGPPPPNSNLPPLPHKSGTLVVRRHFHQDAASGGSNPAATGGAQGSATGTPRDGDQVANQNGDRGGNMQSGSGSNKSGYMSGLYRGLMDYRTSKKTSTSTPPSNQSISDVALQATAASTAPSSSSSSSSSTASTSGTAVMPPSNRPPTGTGSATTFHCILKPPILYLYSSSDVSSPLTECHAAIDLRGKRVSLFVNGVGDTMGEPGEDDDQDGEEEDDDEDDYPDQAGASRSNSRSRMVSNQYDTTSSTNVSDVDSGVPASNFNLNISRTSKRAQRNWNKARRATIRDGELFQKRNAIRIVAMGAGEGRRANDKRRGSGARSKSPASKYSNLTAPTNRAQWFIFCKSASQLEDWYHVLLHASLLPSSLSSSTTSSSPSFDSENSPLGELFSPDHMVQLLASLDSIPDPIPLRWFNAIFARLFFSVYKTSALENYITRKIMKKLSRVKTPGFLGDVVVREVDVGDRPPMFSRPMLKSATGDGEASMEVSVHYTGSLRLTISTTLTISLSSRLGLKPYTVPLVLAVVLRSLNGNLLLHVKPPPSNRLWFGFTKLPEMEIEVQPVVSERKVQWGMVTRLIESRIRELLVESIVVPNMDDVPFFDTRQFAHRGGIWSDAGKGASSAADLQRPDSIPSQPIPPVSTSSKIKSQGTSSAPVTAVGTPETEFPSSKSSALEVPGSSSTKDGSARRRKNSNTSRASLSPSASARVSTSTSADALAVGAPVSLSTSNGFSLDDSLGATTSKLSSSPSSAAAAGLSSLLARDFAAQSQVEGAGGSTDNTKSSSVSSLPAQLEGGTGLPPSIGNDPSQPQQPNKRRSWFVGSRFGNGSGASSPSSEHGPSSPAVNVPSSISRRGGPQSSLAWGNASLSLPPGKVGPGNRTGSVGSVASVDDSPSISTSFESEPGFTAASVSPSGTSPSSAPKNSNRIHERNKDSVSSWSTEESDEGRAVEVGGEESGAESIKSADADSIRTGMEKAFHMDQDERGEAQELDAPSFEAAAVETPTPRKSSHSHSQTSAQQPSHDDIPASTLSTSSEEPPLTPMASISQQPSRSQIPRLKETPPRSQDSEYTSSRGRNAEAPSSLSSRQSTISSTSNTDSSSLSDASSRTTAENVPPSGQKVFGASHGFPPPLLRSATLKAQQGNAGGREGADSRPAAISEAQQNRYGLGSNASSPSPPANTSSTLLLNSWNKAKASMVDKESRQAAAKEAKDALKKGWASWNTKRQGGAQQDQDSLQPSPGSNPSTSHSKGRDDAVDPNSSRSWLTSVVGGGAQTSDPASLGLGFDVDRVERNSRSSASSSSTDGGDLKDRLRSGGSLIGRSASRDDDDARSSGSERTPYKDYRAQKSRTGGQREGNLSQSQVLASTAQWSANVPSLPSPAPAARRRDEEEKVSSSKIQSSSPNSGPPSLHSSTPTGGSPALSVIDSRPASSSSIPRPSATRQGSSPNLSSTKAKLASEQVIPSLSFAPPQAIQPMRKASTGSVSSERDLRRDGSTSSSPQMNSSSTLEHQEVRRGSASGPASSPSGSRIPTASSSTSSKPGIKVQPGRAQMMAIPGIPSMNMSRGPQSFSSPTPEPTPASSKGSPVLGTTQDGQKLGLGMFREMLNKQQQQQAQEQESTSSSTSQNAGVHQFEGAENKEALAPAASSSILAASSPPIVPPQDAPNPSVPDSDPQLESFPNEETLKGDDSPQVGEDKGILVLDNAEPSIESNVSSQPVQKLEQTSNKAQEEVSEVIAPSLQSEPATTAEEAQTRVIALGPEEETSKMELEASDSA